MCIDSQSKQDVFILRILLSNILTCPMLSYDIFRILAKFYLILCMTKIDNYRRQPASTHSAPHSTVRPILYLWVLFIFGIVFIFRGIFIFGVFFILGLSSYLGLSSFFGA